MRLLRIDANGRRVQSHTGSSSMSGGGVGGSESDASVTGVSEVSACAFLSSMTLVGDSTASLSTASDWLVICTISKSTESTSVMVAVSVVVAVVVADFGGDGGGGGGGGFGGCGGGFICTLLCDLFWFNSATRSTALPHFDVKKLTRASIIRWSLDGFFASPSSISSIFLVYVGGSGGIGDGSKSGSVAFSCIF